MWPQLSPAMCSGLAIAMRMRWGWGGETQRVLVVVSCLHFLLLWVIELAPGNPHILGRSSTGPGIFRRKGFCHGYLLLAFCLKHQAFFLLAFYTGELQKGLSHLSLLSSLPPPLSSLILCSQAKRHYLET